MQLYDRIFDLDGWLTRNFPPAGELIDVDGRQIHAVSSGPVTTMPIVLLHGASGNVRDWLISILPELARDHHVIALDRPGFGYSSPPDGLDTSLAAQVSVLRACLNRMGHRRYVLVGHSYSGPLIMRWALDHPDEVAGLLPLSGATNDWGGGLGLGYRLKGGAITGPVLAQVARLIASPSYLQNALVEIFAPQPVPPGYLDTAGVEFALRPLTFHLNAAMMNDLGAQVTAQTKDYMSIACPVTTVHGIADTIVPADIHARTLAEMAQDCEFVLLDGIGHMPHHTAKTEVIGAIRALIARAARYCGAAPHRQSSAL